MDIVKDIKYDIDSFYDKVSEVFSLADDAESLLLDHETQDLDELRDAAGKALAKLTEIRMQYT